MNHRANTWLTESQRAAIDAHRRPGEGRGAALKRLALTRLDVQATMERQGICAAGMGGTRARVEYIRRTGRRPEDT